MRRFLIFFLYIIQTITVLAANGYSHSDRKIIDFNHDWKFYFSYDSRKNVKKLNVTLPYTWDASGTEAAKADYNRTAGIFEKTFVIDSSYNGKRLFLYFTGANSVASVFVNNIFLTEHKGGYTAFCVEITKHIRSGENQIKVQVSNAYRMDVLPLSGDFNIYGGIHRPVYLLTTSANCISPLDNASPGVYLSQKSVSAKSATVKVLTKLSLNKPASLKVRTIITDADKKIIAQSLSPLTGETCSQVININQPHLWNGKTDPYLYTVKVQLIQNGGVTDEIEQPLGLRYYKIDPDKGFFLNGKYLDLHGVGFHEDVKGKGSALDSADLDKDMELIKEIGATALRFTHYPHSQYFYDLCDKNGLVIWSEIPLVGPGGYTGTGYVNNDMLKKQIKQVLVEMIRQNYNHPSVFFWGLFNELRLDGDDPRPFLKQMDKLAKTEDPSRLTTCASFLDGDQFNDVTDLIGWNKYYGWYGGKFKDLSTWADKTHAEFPQKPFAVSEFGAGGSPYQHTETLEQPVAPGRFHPEEWQSFFHESSWKELMKRPFIWGKFIWTLTDFASSLRTEGDRDGINDKGLVTYDQKIKKDAFYFYKANWNPEPMIYIADRRNAKRNQPITTIKVYSNIQSVELWLNGAFMGSRDKNDIGIVEWPNVTLAKGPNKIVIKAQVNGKVVEDMCEWELLQN